MQQEIYDKKINELKEKCKQLGLRVTNQRIIIYSEILKSKEHPDAETLFEIVRKKAPEISLDTVYRTLSSLEDMNMIFRVDSLLPKARYDADLSPHCHFLCTKCNEVYDIILDKQVGLDIAKKCNLGEIQDLNLQIRGVCNKCLNNKGD